MKLEWDLAPSQLSFGFSGIPKRIEHVLAEYDGPQLVTLLDDKKNRFLGIASDADRHAVRWIHAPISELEFFALIDGSQNVRDALLKDTVWIVDTTHAGETTESWEVSADRVPQSALPDHGALVPPSARSHLVGIVEKKRKKAPGTNYVALGGKPVVDNRIPFDVLSAFTGAFQRLCTTFADAVSHMAEIAGRHLSWDPHAASLVSAGATAPSSYAIEVHPADAHVLSIVLDEYRSIVQASDNDPQVKIILERLNRRAAAAYVDFLHVIDERELEVFTNWTTGAAFVGPDEARRIRGVTSLQLVTASEKAEPVKSTGHFVGFKYGSRKGSFEFVELGTNRRYHGTVSPQLRIRFTKTTTITLGSKVMYKIKMLVRPGTTKLGRPRDIAELVDFTAIEDSPAPEPAKKEKP